MYLGQKPSTTSGFYQQQWRSNQQNSWSFKIVVVVHWVDSSIKSGN
jgi:hypothetical protein